MVDIENGEHYATSYSLKAHDLYTDFFRKHKVRAIPEYTYYCNREYDYLGRIFTAFMQLVITDIIENQVTFKLPIKGAYIEMIPFSAEEFTKARQNGAFSDVDFLSSNFTGYQIYYRKVTRYGKRLKRIYVTKKYKDRITELTNKGVGW